MSNSKFSNWLVLIFLLLISCNKNEDCEISDEILDIPLQVEIHRLEVPFFENISVEIIKSKMEENPAFTAALFSGLEYSSKEKLAEDLFKLHNDPDMQDLYQEVKTYFSDLSDIEHELEKAFKSIKHHYPEFEPPVVYTFITGFGTDLIVTEELIMIGLDYYLPDDHQFQPIDLPQYIAKRYTVDHLVPTLVTAISTRFNQTDLKENTLLAEMVYYGKSYHFTKSILPCTPDEFIIGYETEEVIGSYANEALIWGHFIENELLYETNPFEIRKYTGEAPFTDVISPDAPGRIGRWLGWNIVDDYRINNDLSLRDLMAEESAREIFRKSGYKPR
ncbi:MAG: gliding motility lipoprotein GldB [Cyclobacteriaceae bacterium]